MKIYLSQVFVDDQAKAIEFYTSVLGFEKRHDVPVGTHRWLTVGNRGAADGMELLLEPDAHPAARAYKAAIKADGIPAAQFLVDDVAAEFERLSAAGVSFVQPPMEAGPVRMAVFDDTCGNLIQMIEMIAQDSP
jgi:predicted enzyme related to lactoylglutathione lyase